MAGSITPEQFEYLEAAVLEAAVPALRGLDCINVTRNVPANVQEISRDRVEEITKAAKIISKRGDYDRVTIGKARKTTFIFQIGLGFALSERDILSGQAGGGEPITTLNARKVSRKVAEKIDDFIFNGESRLNINGIYTGAGTTYAVTKKWDTNVADPYDDINEAVIDLQDEEFDPQYLVLHPQEIGYMRRKDLNGNRFIDQVAELLPNGMASIIPSKTLTKGTGILCDAGPDIAQVYLQEDINLRTFPMTSNEVQDFNIRSKLGMDIHETKAFVKLTGISGT